MSVPFAPHFDENQALFAAFDGALKLPFRRRDALRILKTVERAEEPDIDGAAINLVQKNFSGATGLRRHVLENERLKMS